MDLTEAKDLSARITGLQVTSSTGGASTGDQWGNMDAPIVVHFGDSDFQNKFLTVLNDIRPMAHASRPRRIGRPALQRRSGCESGSNAAGKKNRQPAANAAP